MRKETDTTTEKTSEIQTHHNNHSAMRKLKDAQVHIQMMKRRFQVLKVKDDEHRSKTIQNQNKLKQYDNIRQSIKKDKFQNEKIGRLKLYQIETKKDKNQKLKKQIQKKVKTSRQTTYTQKVEENKKLREQHFINQEKVSRTKDQDLHYNQERRMRINKLQQNQKMNISRYVDTKIKDTITNKSKQTDDIFSIAQRKQKQLQRLSKLQQQMIKRNSQSVQVSQQMKNRLRNVLGDQRRFTKLPSVHSRTSQFTTSSHSTQLVVM